MSPAAERVLQFAAEYQWWLYGLLGLLLLFYLRRAIAARQHGRRSIFRLEQEQARGRYSRSVIVILALLAVGAAVFGLTNFLGPELARPPDPTARPTNGPLSEPTLTATPLPPTMTPTPTATKLGPTRVVATSTPLVVVTPTPLVRPPACANHGARLTSPGVNQVVRGDLPVRGVANIAGFHYYKIEVAPGPEPGDGDWTVVGVLHYAPQDGGELETFNSGAYPPGVYTLRLVVVDSSGNYPEPCRVIVTVQR